MNPYISIIVPSYNHDKFLGQRLKTIFDQTYRNFEVILLDDNSIDGSKLILEDYKKHDKVSHFIINEYNSGTPFHQWNKGLSLARGEYIWIAESDDFCEPDFLMKLIEFRNKSGKDLGLIYSQTLDVNEKGNLISSRLNYTSEFYPNLWEKSFLLEGNFFIESFLKVKNVIPNASAVIFKKKLVEERIFTPELLGMQMCGDWLFWLKICRNTDIGFCSDNLNYFRSHDKTTREHSSEILKKKRLYEEKLIRSYISKWTKIDQKLEIHNLYFEWSRLFSIKGLIKKELWSILINKKCYFKFLKIFLFQKLLKMKVIDHAMLKFKDNLKYLAFFCFF